MTGRHVASHVFRSVQRRIAADLARQEVVVGSAQTSPGVVMKL